VLIEFLCVIVILGMSSPLLVLCISTIALLSGALPAPPTESGISITEFNWPFKPNVNNRSNKTIIDFMKFNFKSNFYNVDPKLNLNTFNCKDHLTIGKEIGTNGKIARGFVGG